LRGGVDAATKERVDMRTAISDNDLAERLPDVLLDADNKDFYRGWLTETLLIKQCQACGHWHHPPKAICPACWSSDVVATEVSGRGTVDLMILLHQGPPTPGVDYARPHPVVSVELEEQPGLRYTSTVIDHDPHAITIGQQVELAWVERHGVPYPVFRICQAEGEA
jgi:uncharacterized OB-fold protein